MKRQKMLFFMLNVYHSSWEMTYMIFKVVH